VFVKERGETCEQAASQFEHIVLTVLSNNYYPAWLDVRVSYRSGDQRQKKILFPANTNTLRIFILNNFCFRTFILNNFCYLFRLCTTREAYSPRLRGVNKMRRSKVVCVPVTGQGESKES